MTVDAADRREVTRELYRHPGGYELVAAPAILALLGLWLDRTVGTTPLFTVTLGVLAFVGVFVKMWFTYSYEMRQHEEAGPWARR
jgi:hypothetical protein